MAKIEGRDIDMRSTNIKALLFFLSSFCCSTVIAGMLASESAGKPVWQAEVNTMYVDQSNVLPQISGVTLGPSSILGSSNPFGKLADLIAPDPNDVWGVGGRLGYVFASHKYDIQLRYFGVNSDMDTNRVQTIAGIGTFPFEQDSGYHFNSAELMFGVYYKLSQRLTSRISYGVAYVDIDQTTNATAIDLLRDNELTTFNDKSHFFGFGPKVRLDGQFDLIGSLSAVAAVGVSSLFGESKTEADFTDTTNVLIVSTYSKSTDPVAIGIDAKLGLRYAATLGDEYSLNIEAGYDFDTYLNAFEGSKFQQTSGATGETLFYATDSNYTNSGPYISLSMDFF